MTLGAGELQQRAVRGIASSALATVVAMPLAIAVSVVLARTLGPEGYARFAYLAFAVHLLQSVTDLGFAQAIGREASRAYSSGDLERTRELCSRNLGFNLLRLPVVYAGALVIARPSPAVALGLLAAFACTYAAMGVNASLNAENRGATMARLALASSLVTSAATAGAALAGASATTVWAMSFASAAVVVPGWIRAANPALRRAALRPRLPRGLPAGTWRFALVSAAAALGTMLVFSRSEVLVLQAFEETHALAVFALAYGLSQRLTTPIDTVLGPLIPALSALDAAEPGRLDEGVARALRLAAAAAAGVAAAGVAGTALLAPLLYGSGYGSVGAAFAALAGVSLLQSAAQPYLARAYALGRPGLVLRALVAALAVDMAAAIALIPVAPLAGALAANALGGAVAVCLLVRASGGLHAVRAARVPVARLALATATAVPAALAAGLAVGGASAWGGAAVAYAVGVAVFAVQARGLIARVDAEALLRSLPTPLARRSRTLLLRWVAA